MAILATRQTNFFFEGVISSQTISVTQNKNLLASINIGDYQEIEKFLSAVRIPDEVLTINGKAVPLNVKLELVTNHLPTETIREVEKFISEGDKKIIGVGEVFLNKRPEGVIEFLVKVHYPEFMISTPTAVYQPKGTRQSKISVQYHQ